MDDHYKTLGVEEKATDAEIKKAFRRLSLKHHPDKGGDQGEFQKINGAYQVLGDKNKREQYNMQKNNPFMGMHGNDGVENIFKMFFGGGMPGMAGMHGMHGMHGMPGMPGVHIFRNGQRININSMRKPPPIVKKFTITLTDAFKGTTLAFDFERWVITNREKKTEKERIYIPIKKGIDNSEIMIIRNKGHVNENLTGDIKLFVNIKNNTKFERKGIDLHYKKEITLKEALIGFSFDIEHINNKTYTINNTIGNIICPNFVKEIAGLGMVRGPQTGKLLIKFNIKFPSTLTENQTLKLKEIL